MRVPGSAVTPRVRRLSGVGTGLALAALTLAVFLPVAGFELLRYDDSIVLTENRRVTSGLTLEGLAWAFTTRYTGNWMPLTWLSHQLAAEAFGIRPAGHHLLNLLLHLGNVLLLFGFLRGATGAVGRSAFVAAVFAVHPLHVESVAWVSERMDVLMVFFGLLALHAWRRWLAGAGVRWYAAAVALFACGMMAKAMLVVLVPVLLVLDFWPFGRLRRRPRGGAAGTWRLLAEKAPLFALSLAAGLVAMSFQEDTGAMTLAGLVGARARLLHALTALLWYLKSTLWPARLAVFYPYPLGGEPLGKVTLAAAVLAALCAGALLLRRRAPFAAAGGLWFLGSLLPVLGFVMVGEHAYADRYTYFALIGAAIAVSWGAAALAGRHGGRRSLLALAAGCVIVALAVACRVQLRHWRDTEALWRRALAVTEGNYVAHNGLGVLSLRQGVLEEAARHFREAARFHPFPAKPLNNLAQVELRRGRVEEGLALYREALRIAPDAHYLHRNLGFALARLGRGEEALQAYREAARLRPDDPLALSLLGELLAGLGHEEEARLWRERARRVVGGERPAPALGSADASPPATE